MNGRIAPSYWPWLEAYDPDVVYSYVPLSRADVLEVHERLSPAIYAFHKFHGEPRLDVFGFKPSYNFAPLPSLSVIFRLARHRPAFGEASPVKIIDCWHTERRSRFLTDNFGTYLSSRATGIYPPDAAAAASLLTIVSPEKQAGHYGVPRNLDAVPNEMVASREFAEQRAASLSLASIHFASKLEFRIGRWSSSFNLVVGDSFTDRVLFWNVRQLIPAWLDTNLYCLRVELDQLKDPEFLATLGDLLKRRNHVNDGAGGTPQVTVRSASQSNEHLAEAHQLVQFTRPWSPLTTEAVTGLGDFLPPSDALRTAKESNRFGTGLFARPDWTRFAWTPPTARPPAIAPDHLSIAPVRQVFIEGYWGTDFVFEYDGPAPRFGDNRWLLPRRWRLAGACRSSLVDEPQHAVPPCARRSRDGSLAIFVSADHPVEAITVPTAYEAIQYALARDGASAERDAVDERAYLDAKQSGPPLPMRLAT